MKNLGCLFLGLLGGLVIGIILAEPLRSFWLRVFPYLESFVQWVQGLIGKIGG